jgi:AsmA protein
MRKLLSLIFTVVVVIIGAALAAPFLISTDAIKATLIEQVETATGRTMKIDGALQLKFFPVASVVAENVTLSNPKESGDTNPMMTLGVLRADVAVMPLLSRNVVINHFILDKADIRLRVYANGRKNWEFAPVVKVDKAAPAELSPKAGGDSSQAMSMLSNINLNQVSLQNSHVSLVDDTKKSKLDIKDINTNISMASVNAPIKMSGNIVWLDKKVDLKMQLSTLQAILTNKPADVDLDINTDVIKVSANGKYHNDGFTGKTAVDSSSLKSVMAWLQPASKPLDMSAPLAFKTSGDVQCNATLCVIDQLSIVLDKIDAKGKLKLAMGGKPNINLALDINELDFNPYLPTEKKAENNSFLVSNAFADAGRWSGTPIDLSGLKAMDLNAVIHTSGIKFKNIIIGKSTLNTKINNGKLIADVVDAQLYEGNGSVLISADANSNSIASRAALKNIQLESLLKDTMDMDRLTGKANLDYSITSQGGSQAAIVNNLAGSGQIKLTEGSIQRVNMLDLLRNLKGGAQGDGKATAFSSMGGTFTINKGVINNQDMAIAMTGMNVAGKGEVNLPAYTINYRLTPQTIGKAQDGKSTEGLSVPVLISGSLDNPNFQPDAQALIQDMLNDPKKLKEQLKNNQREIKEQLKDPKEAVKNLKGLLQGL